MDVKGGRICVADTAAANVGLVGQDQGGGDSVHRNAGTLVVVADGGDDGGHLSGIASHVVENAPGHDCTRLGMILPVHKVTDIVEIPGDFRQLHGPLVVAHGLQNISGSLRHMHHMGEAVLRKAQGPQRFIGPDDVGFDRVTFRDLFVSQHIDSSFEVILSRILQKERGWGDILQRFYWEMSSFHFSFLSYYGK